MAHKKHSHLVLSDKQCEYYYNNDWNNRCRRKLKQNLVDRKPRAKYCYKHYMKLKRQAQNQST